MSNFSEEYISFLCVGLNVPVFSKISFLLFAFLFFSSFGNLVALYFVTVAFSGHFYL